MDHDAQTNAVRWLRSMRLEAQIASGIHTHGFFILQVYDPRGHKPWYAYTIGLHQTNPQLPEILLIGLPQEQGLLIVNAIGHRLLTEERYVAGQTVTDLLEEDYPGFLGAVEPCYYAKYVGQAIHYYGHARFPLWQWVWCDEQRRFPWQQGFDPRFRACQPILFDPRRYGIPALAA